MVSVPDWRPAPPRALDEPLLLLWVLSLRTSAGSCPQCASGFRAFPSRLLGALTPLVGVCLFIRLPPFLVQRLTSAYSKNICFRSSKRLGLLTERIGGLPLRCCVQVLHPYLLLAGPPCTEVSLSCPLWKVARSGQCLQ